MKAMHLEGVKAKMGAFIPKCLEAAVKSKVFDYKEADYLEVVKNTMALMEAMEKINPMSEEALLPNLANLKK